MITDWTAPFTLTGPALENTFAEGADEAARLHPAAAARLARVDLAHGDCASNAEFIVEAVALLEDYPAPPMWAPAAALAFKARRLDVISKLLKVASTLESFVP